MAKEEQDNSSKEEFTNRINKQKGRISSKLKYAKTCNYWQNLQFYLRRNLVFPYLEEIPI